jgi:magnesium transporter
VVTLMGYGTEGIEELTVESLDEIPRAMERWPTVWVNVVGVGDVETVSRIGELFALHPLALEDVVHLGQRAKVEEYDEQLFIVARSVLRNEAESSEQISLFVGTSYVVTFQEVPGDPFDPVRDRLRGGRRRIRQGGSDYLAYALLDAVIDQHFPVLDALGQRLEELERTVVADPDDHTLHDLLQVRSELLGLRRDLLPHRDLLQALIRGESPLVRASTTVYLRDCADHVDQLNDLLSVYRELSSDLMACYLSSVSNRMNEVMKVLTIIATIFIPLGFVAGVYGMNFDPGVSPWNMPELGWRFGYPAVLALMAAVAVGMLFFFRRLGWLGGRRVSNRKGGASSVP